MYCYQLSQEGRVYQVLSYDKYVLITLENCFFVIFNGTLYFVFRSADIEDSEYDEFYKSFSKDSDEPMCRTHFTAEGEVTFKSILFIPKTSPTDWQNSSKNKVGTG